MHIIVPKLSINVVPNLIATKRFISNVVPNWQNGIPALKENQRKAVLLSC